MTTFEPTVIPAEPAGLTLYFVIPRADAEGLMTRASFKLPKIGLCERKYDAVRSQIKQIGSITKDSHVALEIRFTALGVAHYVTSFQGREQGYQSMLKKKHYEVDIDLKVWYFSAELPWRAEDKFGNLLVSTVIVPID